MTSEWVRGPHLKLNTMPKDRSFIDASANIGRPYLAPEAESIIEVQPYSRSLKELSKFDAESRKIHAQIKDGILRLDLSHVIGDRIVINKKSALKFAKWILETYESNKRV